MKTIKTIAIIGLLFSAFTVKADEKLDAYNEGFADGYKSVCGYCFPPFPPFPSGVLWDEQSAYVRGVREGAAKAQRDGKGK